MTWSISGRRLGVLLLLAMAGSACDSKRFPKMTDPVEGLLKEIRSGSQIVPRYRPYFTDSVKDQEIRNWFETIREALRRHGDSTSVEIVENASSDARMIVWVGENSQDRPHFSVAVAERLTGWRIAAIDIHSLGRLLPTTIDDAPFSKHHNVWD